MSRHSGPLVRWVGVLVLLLLPLVGGGAVLADGGPSRSGTTAEGVCHEATATGAPSPISTQPDTGEDCARSGPGVPTATEAAPTARTGDEPTSTDTPTSPPGPEPTSPPDPTSPVSPTPTATAEPTATTAPEPAPTATPPAPTAAPQPTPTVPPGADPITGDRPTVSETAGQDPVDPAELLVTEVVLTLNATSGEVGAPLSWTATVYDGTAPVPGATVHFLGQLLGQEDVEETLSTDDGGSASLTHTRLEPGTETLTVTVESEGGAISATRTFLWWEGNDNGLVIELEPLNGSGLVGGTAEFVATVTDNGAPAVGELVDFRGLMDGQETVWLEGVTGEHGTATFHHSREVAGTEDILVVLWEAEVDAETTFTWRGPLQVTMSAGDGSAEVGSTVQWTATVTDAELGSAWEQGVSVRFLGRMAGQPDVDVTLTTGPDGVATYLHTRSVAGMELLEVTATLGDESASDEANFEWLEPAPVTEIEIEPQDSSGLVGEPVEFLATVTLGDDPVSDEFVFFSATMVGVGEVYLEGTTDDEGQVAFQHTRAVPGTDNISVSTYPSSAEADTTFIWEPMEVEITLEPLEASGPIGEPVEFVATVTGNGEPLEGETVYFSAYWEGEEGGSTFLDGVTDANGIARFEHAEDRTGVQNIAVDTPAYGQEAWAETTFTWEPVEVELTLEPLDSSAEVGSTVEFAATVMANGTPRPGVLVYFFAAYEDSDDYVSLEAVTDEDGVARFLHTRQDYGLENVIVSTYALENEVSAETTFTWRGPLQVQLSFESGSADVGTEVTWTATVSSEDPGSIGAAAPGLEPAWEEGVSVRFLAQMAGEPDVDITLPTDADGIVSFTHTRLVPGTEIQLVTATVGAETATADTTFEWLQPDPTVQIEVEPRDAAGPVGQQVEFVATVTGDGEPLEGQLVYFSAQMEAEVPGVFLVGLTGADGTASFEHSREVTGVEAITVETPAFGQEAWNSTSFTWELAPPLIVLHQNSTSGGIGTPLQWSATVTSGDEVVEGASVRFLGQLSGQPDVDVTVLTDTDGVATYSHTRTVAGTESLMVGATVDDQTVFANGSFEWLVPVPIIEIEVQPSNGSGPVGTTQEFVAAVTVDGEPAADQLVTFTATMTGAAPVSIQGETDAKGVARFDHSRSLDGVDSITVQAAVSGQTVVAQTTYTWQAPAAPPTLTLTQSGTSGVVGTDLVWTATVTSGGEPVQGASVRFLGQLPGDGPVDVTVTTNASGQATHTHSRSVAGTESLQVTATIAGQPLIETGSFTWLAEPTDPPGGETPGEPPGGETPGEPPGGETPGEPPTQTPGEPPTQEPGEPPAGEAPPTSLPVTPTPVTATTPGPEDEGAPEPDPEPGTETEAGPAPSTDVPGTPPSSAPPLTTVALGSASATPGGDLEVTGTGCEPGSTVTITLAGEALATTTADSTGAFSARAAVASVPLGQYAVDVQCGDATGEAVVDLVSTAESSTAVASAASAAAVLTFFVLLGSSVFRSTFGSVG
ncbi:hypothetical protein FNH13_18215 [Ornithinimicrobium ciconiae]|uniref:Big-1 domain-containing protein n=1 Tax=Ornithinimicrobium ciconiae TaxID=2594265 RepID=A0A516GEU4_9MICO|nr:hypothetical protein [Ornithinimicrobium ciconiae]QDO90018.1 hypothetical protein FNH13_18215 [Ornithinimicrobium ciconiae]